MAALDDIEIVSDGGFGNTVVLTFTAAPTEGELIVLAFANGAEEFDTVPAGFTEVDPGTGYGPFSTVLAKIAGPSEPTSYTATIANERNFTGIGRRIAGPIESVVCSGDDTSYGTSNKIVTADKTVAPNTKVIAMMFYAETAAPSISSVGNSFGNQQSANGNNCHIYQWDRLYASAASDVTTTVAIASGNYGRSVLLRIEAADDVEPEPEGAAHAFVNADPLASLINGGLVS